MQLEDVPIQDPEARDVVGRAGGEFLASDDLIDEEPPERRFGFRIHQPAEGKLDVAGRQLAPVMEPDALAKIERVAASSLGNIPVLGQIRDDIEVVVQADKPVEDLLGDENRFPLGWIEPGQEGGVEVADAKRIALGIRRLINISTRGRRGEEQAEEDPGDTDPDDFSEFHTAEKHYSPSLHPQQK